MVNQIASTKAIQIFFGWEEPAKCAHVGQPNVPHPGRLSVPFVLFFFFLPKQG